VTYWKAAVNQHLITQHNGTQHINIVHKDTQHNDIRQRHPEYKGLVIVVTLCYDFGFACLLVARLPDY